MSSTAPRVVLDTNAWLDLLWFRDPRSAALADALSNGRLCAVASAECRDEWQRVLGYDVLRIGADARMRLCHAFDARVQIIEATAPIAALPRCRDPDDQKFLEAALAAGAQFLVTKDRELLALDRRRFQLPFRIVAPADFQAVSESA